MSEIREFQVNLFSNSCDDAYQNTLSCFTTKLYPTLKLDENKAWGVGLSQIFFNSLENSNSLIVERKDCIIFDKLSTAKFLDDNNGKFTIKSFCLYLMKMCTYHDFYTLHYFKNYLHNHHFNIQSWNKLQTDDIIISHGQHLLNVDIELDLSELLDKNETSSEFLPKQMHTFEENQSGSPTKWFKSAVFKFNCLHSYTLKQILNTIIRFLFSRLKYLTDTVGKQDLLHGELIKSFDSFDSYRNHENKALRKCDVLITRFINEFVRNILESCRIINQKISLYKEPSFIFIYCDIIKPTYVGNSTAQVIRILPPLIDGRSYLFLNPITFSPLSSHTIPEINVLITDEEGERLKFTSSFVPTHLSLTFKRMKE